MTRGQVISTADFVHSAFGADADVEIDDDGPAFITTPQPTFKGFFAYAHESIARLTLIP